jgi:hypothetical protein
MSRRTRDAALGVLIASFFVVAMATATRRYGWHSTPGIVATLANIPGVIAAAWFRSNEVIGFFVTLTVNALFYYAAIQLIRRAYKKVAGVARR